MKEYGPVFKVTIPPKGCPAMVICDPQIAGQVRLHKKGSAGE